MSSKNLKPEQSSVEEPEKFTYFYGKKEPFSQHHPSFFVVDTISYNCAEQYMMHQKAVLFNDDKMAVAILKEESPVKQKRFGRRVKNFDDAVWKSKAEEIVKTANKAKFSQNSGLKACLLATRGTTLAESSPRDRLWGIGWGRDNPLARDRQTWRGKNLLGFILTSVRDEMLLEKEKAEQGKNEGGQEFGAKRKDKDNCPEGSSPKKLKHK